MACGNRRGVENLGKRRMVKTNIAEQFILFGNVLRPTLQ